MSFKSFAIAAALFAGMAGQMSVAQDLKGDVQAGEKKKLPCALVATALLAIKPASLQSTKFP